MHGKSVAATYAHVPLSRSVYFRLCEHIKQQVGLYWETGGNSRGMFCSIVHFALHVKQHASRKFHENLFGSDRLETGLVLFSYSAVV